MSSKAPAEEQRTPGTKSRWGLPVLLGVQLAVTLPFISAHPLWVDEAYSSVLARSSFTDIIRLLHDDAGPPLYYFLLHIWQALAGSSETALRIPSLAFALLTTGVIFISGKQIVGQRAATIAAILWASNPLVWHYSLEARPYTLLAFLTLVFLIQIHRVTQEPRGWNRGWIATGIALVYTHNLAWFVCATGFIIGLSMKPGWRNTIRIAAGMTVIVLTYLPWIPVLIAQMNNTALTIDWVKHFWTPWAPLLSLNAFLPGGWTPLYMDRPAFPLALQVVIACGAAILLAYPAWQSKDKRRVLTGIPGTLLLLLVFPHAASWAGIPVYLIARTDFFALPLFLLLLGSGCESLRCGTIRNSMVFTFVVLGGNGILQEITREPEVDQGILQTYLQRTITERDVVLCTGLTRPVIDHALRDTEARLLSYPRDMETQLAHINEAWYNETLDLKAEAAEILEYARASVASTGGTLWIISSPRPINAPLMQHLQPRIERVPLPRAGLRKLNEPLDVFRHVDP